MSESKKTADRSELTANFLDLTGAAFSSFGATIRAISHVAGFFPPLALLLEGIANITESASKDNSELSDMERGAQILVGSVTIIAASLSFAALFVAALSPAAPAIFVVAAAMLTVGTLYELYLKYNSEDFKKLEAQKIDLQTSFDELGEFENKEMFEELFSPSARFSDHDEDLFESKFGDDPNLRAYFKKRQAWKKNEAAYNKHDKEIRQLSLKALYQSLFLAVLTLSMIAVAINPFAAPILLVVVGVYVAYRTGLINKVSNFIFGQTDQQKYNVAHLTVKEKNNFDYLRENGLDHEESFVKAVDMVKTGLGEEHREDYLAANKAHGHANALALAKHQLNSDELDSLSDLRNANVEGYIDARDHGFNHDDSVEYAGYGDGKHLDIKSMHPELDYDEVKSVHELTSEARMVYDKSKDFPHEQRMSLTKLTDQQLSKFKTNYDQNSDFATAYKESDGPEI